jgi:menaquinone-specific isochorismate synthase
MRPDSKSVTHSNAHTRVRFEAEHLPTFLNGGWLLSLDAERVLVGWGDGSPQADGEPLSSCSIYAPDFYLQDARPWRVSAHWDLLERDRLASIVLTAFEHNVNEGDQRFQWVEPEKSAFSRSWLEIHDGMHERGLEKAVPVVFASSRGVVGPLQKVRILRSVLSQSKHLYMFGFWDSGAGMLGATPELLFSKRGELAVETMALAGTRPRAEVAKILEDPKERREHQLVIDDIRAVLAEVGDVEVGATGVLELPTLVHLKTSLKAKLREPLGLVELVRRLHPTAALGVFPRAMGFEEIRRWDSSQDRGRFGAPFGAKFKDPVTGEQNEICVVAIRGVQWSDRTVRLGSGCGIVRESDFEREWSELALKRDSVKRMLDL